MSSLRGAARRLAYAAAVRLREWTPVAVLAKCWAYDAVAGALAREQEQGRMLEREVHRLRSMLLGFLLAEEVDRRGQEQAMVIMGANRLTAHGAQIGMKAAAEWQAEVERLRVVCALAETHRQEAEAEAQAARVKLAKEISDSIDGQDRFARDLAEAQRERDLVVHQLGAAQEQVHTLQQRINGAQEALAQGLLQLGINWLAGLRDRSEP